MKKFYRIVGNCNHGREGEAGLVKKVLPGRLLLLYILSMAAALMTPACLDEPAPFQELPVILEPVQLLTPVNGETGVNSSTTFSWTPVSGATKYRAQFSLSSSFNNLVLDDEFDNTSMTIEGYSNNTTYFWRVSALSSNGSSPWSPAYSFTTESQGGGTVPAAPTLSSPSNGATGVSLTPTLSWNASSGATSYGLQVSTGPTFSSTIVNLTGVTSTSRAISGLSGNTTYYWRVNATNNAGTSSWSTIRSFITTSSGSIPPVPTLSSPANGATGVSLSPTLSWNASTNATSYNIQVSTNSSFSTTIVNQTNFTSTSGTITNPLSPNTTHYWRVSATNSSGTSAWSSVRSFTTTSSGLLLNEGFENGIPGSWTSTGSAAWYTTSSSPGSGNISVRSGSIADNQYSGLRTSVSFTGNRTISFMYKTSSEPGYDYLEFYINGIRIERWSGENPWSNFSYVYSGSGTVTLEWRYNKDVSDYSGSDAVYIDNVKVE